MSVEKRDECFERKILQRSNEPTELSPLLEISTSSATSSDTMTSTFKGRLQARINDRKLTVDLCAVLFGVGSWIGVNGLFNQLPLLVKTAPEQWNLPSYLTIIIQIANIGPLTYSLLKKFKPSLVNDAIYIYFNLIVGTLSAILFAFLYSKTSYIFGELHSTVLFVLVFFLALVGCTSSVLFMPYMGHYREIYLITYLVGEGLSGLLPSVVALVQGVGGPPTCTNGTDGTVIPTYAPPLFEPRDFFLFISAMLVISTISFFALNNLTVCRNERVDLKDFKENDDSSSYSEKTEALYDSGYTPSSTENTQSSQLNSTLLPSVHFKALLVLMAGLCFYGNGVLPSIQSYACLPYSDKAYHLSVALSTMANPLACFIAVFVPNASLRTISGLTATVLVFDVYVLVTALMSPSPPLVHESMGAIIIVTAMIFVIGLNSYTKLSITSTFRCRGSEQSLFWCGALSQSGSAVGAILMFFLINYTGIFVSVQPCQQKNLL